MQTKVKYTVRQVSRPTWWIVHMFSVSLSAWGRNQNPKITNKRWPYITQKSVVSQWSSAKTTKNFTKRCSVPSMLYNSIPLYCTDVTSTLACGLPEDGEEFAENLQPFSQMENAQEKAHFRWKMQNRFGRLSIFWERFALVDFLTRNASRLFLK